MSNFLKNGVKNWSARKWTWNHFHRSLSVNCVIELFTTAVNKTIIIFIQVWYFQIEECSSFNKKWAKNWPARKWTWNHFHRSLRVNCVIELFITIVNNTIIIFIQFWYFQIEECPSFNKMGKKWLETMFSSALTVL